jgi:hypothetical protein
MTFFRATTALITGSLLWLLASAALAAPQQALSTVSGAVNVAMPGQSVLLRLKITGDQQIVFNHRAPNQINVVTPWGKSYGLKTFRGVLWPVEPEFYFTSLEQVAIAVPVPKNTKAGRYTLTISADFGLCHASSRVCFHGQQQASAVLLVGENHQGVGNSVGSIHFVLPTGLPTILPVNNK